jgi:hypothetical protein
MRCAAIAPLLLVLPLWAQVKFAQEADRIQVEIDGKHYTTFYLAPGGNKPYVYPLSTASGIVVTRHFPMEAFPGETKDHPHHRGMFFSHGEVNGYNFWATEPGTNSAKAGRMVLKKVLEAKGGQKAGTVSALFTAEDPKGEPLMSETRTITFYSDPRLRAIDYEARIDAIERLVFGDTKEGTFGIRRKSFSAGLETEPGADLGTWVARSHPWGVRLIFSVGVPGGFPPPLLHQFLG